MPAAGVQQPVGNFIFKLTLGGAEAAGYFAEVAGFATESHVIEHTAATPKGLPLPQKFPGQISWTNITLKRGVDKNAQLWTWRKAVLEGKIDANRKDCQVDVLDWTQAIVVTFKFIRAWPCKYSSPGLNAGGNEILVEELELAHEGFERA
jgi:phage tail-like protein